jgi:hypothetical protein
VQLACQAPVPYVTPGADFSATRAGSPSCCTGATSCACTGCAKSPQSAQTQTVQRVLHKLCSRRERIVQITPSLCTARALSAQRSHRIQVGARLQTDAISAEGVPGAGRPIDPGLARPPSLLQSSAPDRSRPRALLRAAPFAGRSMRLQKSTPGADSSSSRKPTLSAARIPARASGDR